MKTNLEQKLSTEIVVAMKEKNERRKVALRAIKTSFDVLSKSGKEVSEELQLKEIQRLIKQRNESAKIYSENNRQDLLDVELFEIDVLNEFLPKQLSEEEVNNELKNIIKEIGLDPNNLSERDFGKIMGIANKKLTGQTTGHVISTLLRTYITLGK